MTQYTYALIDGVMRQTAIKDLYQTQELVQVIPLYIGTRFQDNYDLGPILVASLEGSPLIHQLQQQWHVSTTILQSEQYISVIAEHLKQFITVTDETGSTALFRFADPLVTWYWLTSYQQNIPLDIFGPITSWQVIKPIADWQQPVTEWHTFKPMQDATLTHIRLDYLNEPQVKALDEAADFRFKCKQYQLLIQKPNNPFLGASEQQITNWLDQTVANAEANNLQTQRAIAIWLDLVADYGEDFLKQPGGAYQTWITHNHQNKSLPLEINLEGFYRQLHNI